MKGLSIMELFKNHNRAERSVEGDEAAGERQVYVARCAFEIHGVTARQPIAKENPEGREEDRMLASLVSVLEEGQRVTLAYEGGGRRPLSWQIIGEASSLESASQAKESLHNVQNALLTTLESRKADYRFKLVSDKAVRDGLSQCRWVGHIHPLGTYVKNSKSRLGFSHSANSVQEQDAGVYLPHYTRKHARAFSSIIDLLVSSSAPLRIEITLEACHLSSAQEQAVKSALELIQDSGPGSNFPAHLTDTTNIWLKALGGCRISCAVKSSSAVSESFMRMLGGELYHGAVDVQCYRESKKLTPRDPAASSVTDPILDLRNCIPSVLPLPALFPQADVLARHGMRRFYNREKVVLPKKGLLAGQILEGRETQQVRLCPKQRGRHTYVLGATGVGKSTLLFNLLMQDIQNGEGVCLVDPHGDLFHQTKDAIPANRVKDVIIIDPSDGGKFSVGLNLLDLTGPHREMQKQFVINEFLAILEKLYDMRHCGGPMFEQYFRGALQLIMGSQENPGTLVEMSAVFEHKAYREGLLKQAGASLLTDFWRMAERTGGEAALANVAPYIVSKLNSFVHNAMLRPIIGQTKNTVDFREIMDHHGILLVNLSRGALGELDMRLLGMIILTKLICAGMSRLNIAPSRRKPFMVYVDEFQHFTTDATASLLSESRKYGINLILANQTLSQLSANKGQENLVHSVLGNVGSMALFRLGAPDAEKLAVYTRPNFLAEDLQTLPNFHAAARFLTTEGPTVPFVFQTHPAPRRRVDPSVQKRLEKARRRYSTESRIVEEEICKRREAIRAMGVIVPDKKVEKQLAAIFDSVKGKVNDTASAIPKTDAAPVVSPALKPDAAPAAPKPDTAPAKTGRVRKW
jgi:hypothetical protein